MIHLWVAVQKANGTSAPQIEDRLNELTGLELTLVGLELAKDYGAIVKDSAILATLGKDLSRSGSLFTQYYVTTQNGKQYIVFKGNHRLRKIITGTRYLASNTKLMNLGIGGNAVKAAAKSGFLVSVIFSASLHSIRWLFEEDYRWTSWFVHLSTDVIKVAIAGVAGYLAATATSGAFLAVASTAPVLLPIAVGIVVCLITGAALSYYDDKERIESLIEGIEYYERQARNLKNLIKDGVYYVAEESGRFVAKQIRQFFISKLRILQQRLNPRWTH